MDSPGPVTEVKTVGADDRDLEPGQQVGEYVVEAKVGAGGFGTVFRGTHPLIGKLVAIKVLKRQYSADPEMVSRFVAEARAVNQIRHRNIIDIFAFGALADGRHYYVMEYLDGLPLDQYLDSIGQVPLAEAVPILRAVARALDAAHAKGIAHRDLKPENVFLARDPDGTTFPKLLDFGIAKLLGQSQPEGGSLHKTRTGAPIGTPYYMSPEQCRGRDVDHRTDIYAFGVVAFKLLTGVVPFDGDDYMDILLKQIGDPPPLPSSINPGLPAAVDSAVLWMLAKDPAERPPNLVTAVRALEDAAVAAGIELERAQPSGVYAATTGRGLAQPTPSGVRPLPGPSGAGGPSRSSGLGAAATVDARRLSDSVGARDGQDEVPRRRSPWPLVLAAIAAVAVGAVVFVVVKAGRSDAAHQPGSVGSTPAPDRGVGLGAGGGVASAGPVGSGGGGGAAGSSAPVAIDPGAGRAGAVTGSTLSPVAAPAVITLDVTGPPAGTEVHGPGGRLLGVAPGPIQIDRGDRAVVLTFTADGYVARSERVTPTADAPLAVKLDKKKAGGAAPSSTRPAGKGSGKGAGSGGRDTIEDPFGTGH